MSTEKAKLFKQAVAATNSAEVEDVRSRYIDRAIKESLSSMVIMGPHLDNYDGLLKSGWTVERLLEETSLQTESSARSSRNLL